MRYEFDIGFIPESVDEKLEREKQEVCDSTDSTPGLAESINGKTWKQIFAMRGDQVFS